MACESTRKRQRQRGEEEKREREGDENEKGRSEGGKRSFIVQGAAKVTLHTLLLANVLKIVSIHLSYSSPPMYEGGVSLFDHPVYTHLTWGGGLSIA